MKKKLCKPKPPPSPPPQMDSGASRETEMAETVFPPEVMEEILARLPVKSVLRFRCVSKSWRFSINSRFFVNKRLRCSAERKVISDDTVLDDDPNKHLIADSTLVGSINGLLCILKQHSFYLWNPTTRISIELPKLEFRSTKYGFGWDEGSDAYKVFVIVSEQGQKIGKLYSTLTNSWKTVEHGCLSVYDLYGFFSCGNIHWLTESGHHIEAFDLKSEEFRTMEQPFELQHRMWFVKIHGYLGVICDNNRTRFDLWVMKKYWVNESWEKQNSAPIPLEYKNNYSYRLQDKGRVKFFPRKDVGKGVKSYHYVESLVSPVFTSSQEFEQEPVQAIPCLEDQPKNQIKRKPASLNMKRRPARQNKRRASSVEVSKEVVPRRQSKGIAPGVEVNEEVVPRRRSKRIVALAEVSKELVQSKRRAAGYRVKENKDIQEIEQEQELVQNKKSPATCEGRPKRQNKQKVMEEEQAHSSVAEGRPKRQNMKMPTRYDA